ncbi:MATE family efflux transporter [Bordetella genomosp. 5]|uniref:MATE family efflux transporter n=1 Tax=Bordetella genomosp. 5 TaxID=1395608 RepID=UPI000B9E7E54|nr:MATE family efflux transporter [Bordetella genomosp. 5]OZI38880.1 MATE family efflux transporter [Bordetella genomosp. 5]
MTAQTHPRSRDAHTERLLTAPIFPVMLSLAGPTLLVMLTQTLVGLLEVWFLSRLGEDVLAGVSVVFPLLALTTALATGAVGGGMLGGVARALGRDDRAQANALVWHAVAIALAFGVGTAGLVLTFGGAVFGAMGASGEALGYANRYAAVVFGGAPLIWLFNALLAVIRGSGNVVLPMRVVCGGGIILIPVSWLLIFGAADFRGLGVTGGALAMVLYYAAGSLIFAIYLWRGQGVLRPSARPPRLQGGLFADILKVGGVSALIATSTNLTIAVVTGYVGSYGLAAVAGYGAAARLEFLLVPISFGIGGPAAILIGTNAAAGRHDRARRAALIAACLGFAVAETIGLLAAIWPEVWLRAFLTDPLSLATGSAYLRHVGPFFGFFGLGFTQYCAAQGTGKMTVPLIGAMARTAIAVGGGLIATTQAGLFTSVGLGMAAFAAAGLYALMRDWRKQE